jgi:uncharacterized cupin superfamily protein
MVPEATIKRTEDGLVPEGEGWYVLNAREARWEQDERFGSYCDFQGDVRWPELGVNVCVLEPERPNCLYHGEAPQEGFLVVSGECLLLVEGEERRLRAWDYFHCPPWTEHVFVGAGDAPCVVLMIGARGSHFDDVLYPVNDLARTHGASVEREARDPKQAYGPRDIQAGRYRHGDLLPPG